MSALFLALCACGATGMRWNPPAEDATAIETPPLAEPDSASQPPAAAQGLEPEIEEAPPQDLEPVPAPSAEEKMVHFAHAWLGLSGEAQRQELLQTEGVYLQDSTPYNLVRYALLTTLKGPERPGSTKRVRGELRSYIDRDKGAETPDELVPLAHLLLHILDEREQLLTQLTSQNETLQRQLDELKAIEEQLRERAGPEPIPEPIQAPQ